jgi:hypothetical protein
VVILCAFAELGFFSLVVAHVEVATNVTIASDLHKFDAQIAIVTEGVGIRSGCNLILVNNLLSNGLKRC